jgi:hypothetical protein
MEQFAGETGSLKVITTNPDVEIIGGTSSFIDSDDTPFWPKEYMLVTSQSATTADEIKPLNILAFIRVPASWLPLQPSATVPALAPDDAPDWYRIGGEEFFSESWEFGEGTERSDLDVFLYNHGHDMTQYFGDMDLSEYEITPGQEHPSERTVILAAPLGAFTDIGYEVTEDIAEITFQEVSGLGLEAGSSGTLNDLAGMITEPAIFGDDATPGAGNIWSSVAVVRGTDFFPGLVYSPTTVSLFTAPVSEVFQLDESIQWRDATLVLFASDLFVDPPTPVFSVVSPEDSINVENTVIIMPDSVLDVRYDLSLLPFPPEISVQTLDNEPLFPADFAHPPEFNFPEYFYTPGSGAAIIPSERTFEPVTIEELGTEFDLNNGTENYPGSAWSGIVWGTNPNMDIVGDGMQNYEADFVE